MVCTACVVQTQCSRYFLLFYFHVDIVRLIRLKLARVTLSTFPADCAIRLVRDAAAGRICITPLFATLRRTDSVPGLVNFNPTMPLPTVLAWNQSIRCCWRRWRWWRRRRCWWCWRRWRRHRSNNTVSNTAYADCSSAFKRIVHQEVWPLCRVNGVVVPSNSMNQWMVFKSSA